MFIIMNAHISIRNRNYELCVGLGGLWLAGWLAVCVQLITCFMNIIQKLQCANGAHGAA